MVPPMTLIVSLQAVAVVLRLGRQGVTAAARRCSSNRGWIFLFCGVSLLQSREGAEGEAMGDGVDAALTEGIAPQ